MVLNLKAKDAEFCLVGNLCTIQPKEYLTKNGYLCDQELAVEYESELGLISYTEDTFSYDMDKDELRNKMIEYGYTESDELKECISEFYENILNEEDENEN